MQMHDYPQADGRVVWLTRSEVDDLLRAAESRGVERRIALGLAAECGLRAQEVVDVHPPHVVDTNAGYKVRVQSGKGDKYREPPLPEALYARVQGFAGDDADPVIDRPRSQLNRWVTQAAEDVRDDGGDDGWRFVSPHDLRRSWARGLIEANVDIALIMEWGGWEDWQTFREHYLSVYSPEEQLREREKVDWL